MSTLTKRKKLFFRIKNEFLEEFLTTCIRLGLLSSIPILVIAFTVKSQAFEGKSDTYLRQALRQQKHVSAVNEQVPLPEDLKRHNVFFAPSEPERNSLDLEESIKGILEQSLVWIKENKNKVLIHAIIIPSLTDEMGSKQQLMPLGGIILYKEK